MIVVIDYKVGNVRSVCNALRHIGCRVKLSCKSEDIKAAGGLVLPGVAAFGYAVNALGTLADQVKEAADYITTRSGGSGAVREVIEYILKNSGRWQQVVQRYGIEA